MKLRNLHNPLVMALFRSLLHPLMSGTVLLLTYEGRRSGRTHNTPVSYVRDGGELLLVSSREHSWWRNLRSGVPVRLRIRGRNGEGVAEAFEGAPAAEGCSWCCGPCPPIVATGTSSSARAAAPKTRRTSRGWRARTSW